MKNKTNICICVSDRKTYSETFIKAQIDQLNAVVIYKSMLPFQDLNSDSITDNANYSILSGPKNIYTRLRTSISNKRKTIRMKNFFREHSIGVVLAEYGQIGVAVMDTCKKNKIPLVVHFHGFDAYKKESLKKFEKKYPELFEYASAIIAVSRDMEKQLIRLGAPAAKVFYNVYGVDISKFKKSDISKTGKQLLFVGRFVEKKAPDLAILAFKKALERVPDAKFYMAGDGPLWNECKKMINDFGLQEKILLLGAKTHDDVVKLMMQSRAYVQHSVVPESGDSEGTPNSILEAQVCGVPVVSTLHAGIKDVVIHGETGFLVEERNVEGMANYMVEILNDVDLAVRMGENAYKHASKNFTLSDSISKLKFILDKYSINN